MNAKPQNDPAILPEWQTIGIILTEPRLRERIPFLQGSDFFDPQAGAIFDAVIVLADAGKPVGDFSYLFSALNQLGKLNRDTTRTIRRAAEQAVINNLIDYAEQIKNAATLRRMKIIGAELIRDVESAGAEPADVLTRHETRLAALGIAAEVSQIKSIDQVANDVLNDLRNPKTERAIYTGMISLDTNMGGFHAGELIVVAARPGCGKTAFALQVAMHNAEQGRGVLFVTLEMQNRELAARELAAQAQVNGRRLRTRRCSERDFQRLEATRQNMSGTPFYLFDPPRATTMQIRGAARFQNLKERLSLIVVDYIGLVRADDPKKPRHEQVAQVTADLKSLAKELQLPIIALCQLNREADNEIPRLSMLRESGAIEQDADVVLFLHRDGNDPAKVTLIVAKHRHGDTGAMDFRFDGPSTRFIDPQAPKF